MDYSKTIRLAVKNDIKSEKQRVNPKHGLPSVSGARKESKQTKGINSASVRAFLEEQEKREKEEAERLKRKPSTAPKDAPKESSSASKASSSKPATSNVDEEPDIDLKKLFSKNDRRVARLPDNAPSMMEMMKEREKLRKQKAKEEEEERIRREKELLMEREREREREREQEKAKRLSVESSSSGHRTKGHHHHHSSENRTKSSGGQFKIPRKPQPPPMSFDEMLALAEKRQNEPVVEDSATPAAPAKPVAPRVKAQAFVPLSQAQKDRMDKLKKNPLPSSGSKFAKNDYDKSSKDRNSLGSQEKPRIDTTSPAVHRVRSVSVKAQLDRRKPANAAPAKSQSDQSRDKGLGNDRGKVNVQTKPSDKNLVNSNQKVADRVQVSSQNKVVARPSSAGRGNASISASSKPGTGSVGQNKQANPRNGFASDAKSKQLSLNKQPLNKQPAVNQRVPPAKTSNGDLNRSNPTVNKRPEESQRLKSDGGEVSNKAGRSGSDDLCQRDQVIKDFFEQCKKLKDSGFLSDSLLKNLKTELRNKLSTLPRNGSSGADRPKTSGNSSFKTPPPVTKSVSEKSVARPSASQSQQSSLKNVGLNKGRTPDASNSSVRKEEKRPDTKQMSAWERIQAENKQFRPKPNPAALKRRREEEYSDSEDEDEEEDDYEDDDLSDFIDDGDDETAFDYSMYIRKMTKYDPSRYDDEDFDDRSMETSYAQQMKEEAYSAREGMREDIEDMIMEEEENKRKMMKKNAAKRARLK